MYDCVVTDLHVWSQYLPICSFDTHGAYSKYISHNLNSFMFYFMFLYVISFINSFSFSATVLASVLGPSESIVAIVT